MTGVSGSIRFSFAEKDYFCYNKTVSRLQRQVLNMRNQIYSIDELQTCLIPVFRQYGVKKAVLFGSYGKGTATASSDIDLMVDSGLRGLRFVGLLQAVRDALGGKDVDLLDVSHIDANSRVEREIHQTGVLLYGE